MYGPGRNHGVRTGFKWILNPAERSVVFYLFVFVSMFFSIQTFSHFGLSVPRTDIFQCCIRFGTLEVSARSRQLGPGNAWVNQIKVAYMPQTPLSTEVGPI